MNVQRLQNGVIVAGKNVRDNGVNELCCPYGLDIVSELCCPYGLDIDNDNQSIVIADFENDRIVEWKMGASHGKVIAGGQDQRNPLDQLNSPVDVLIDKETKSLFIADRGNRRVLRRPLHQKAANVQVIVGNVACFGLAMDCERYLYVSDTENHEVRRYTIEGMNDIVVAGGNGRGNELNQLDYPRYLFVDREQAVYISEENNHRVMKWNRGANQGTRVAGGRGLGNALTQLFSPQGLFVDPSGVIYVADEGNDRVMRWVQGEAQGIVIAGRNGEEQPANQLHRPVGLSFDGRRNFYVADCRNHRVQRFNI